MFSLYGRLTVSLSYTYNYVVHITKLKQDPLCKTLGTNWHWLNIQVCITTYGSLFFHTDSRCWKWTGLYFLFPIPSYSHRILSIICNIWTLLMMITAHIFFHGLVWLAYFADNWTKTTLIFQQLWPPFCCS